MSKGWSVGLSGICTSMLLPGHSFHIDVAHLKITNISFLHKQSIIIWPEPRSFGRYTNYFRSHAPNPTPPSPTGKNTSSALPDRWITKLLIVLAILACHLSFTVLYKFRHGTKNGKWPKTYIHKSNFYVLGVLSKFQ